MTALAPLSIASRMPVEPREFPKITAKSAEEARAERRATNLMPQEALRSGAELGPAYAGDSRADNHASKIHTEIKVDGKVIARIYNSGAAEIADEYAFLSDELGFQNDKMVGPDLAEDRAKRIKGTLQKYGAVMEDDVSLTNLKAPILELLRAGTAQTQEEWQKYMAERGPLDPGTLFSGSA